MKNPPALPAFFARSIFAASAFAVLVAPLNANAQQRFKYSYSGAAPAKYVTQHALDVGDMPGHQIRVASLVTKYGADGPVFDGVKAVEANGWLTSDYLNGNGRFSQYVVLQMENGDKIYQTVEGNLQTSAGKVTYSTVGTLKGGTGKFATLRGFIRGSGVTDFKTGATANPSEGEYWFDK